MMTPKLILNNFFDCVETSPLIRQVKWLKDQREGSVVATDTLYWGLQ